MDKGHIVSCLAYTTTGVQATMDETAGSLSRKTEHTIHFRRWKTISKLQPTLFFHI
jgi:hypothetical protein